METVAASIDSAARALLRGSYGVVRTGGLVEACLQEVLDEADRFFGLDPAEKSAFSRPEILEGYRGFGTEFSNEENGSDLGETFTSVPRNQSLPDIASWRTTSPLHNALRRIAPFHCAVADSVLDRLRRAIDPDGDPIDCEEFSYLRLDRRRAADDGRGLLQDEHEDGSLLTILAARQPGLEIEIDGRFEPALVAPGELLVAPGRILTLMTGGRVRPLAHRLRGVPASRRRASLTFFANADLSRPPRAWAPAPDGAFADIRMATIEALAR